MNRKEKRERLKQDAIAAWNDYQTTGMHLTEQEADAWLSKLAVGDDVKAPECHV